MQIFLSHSSRQKPLVREVRKCLPNHLGTWLDEERLLFGDEIATSIEHTIKIDTDYVLLFIDAFAAASPWVRREIEWTLEAERLAGRTILLPITIEEAAVQLFDLPDLQRRKYLVLRDFSEASVHGLAEAISGELFALVCRDVHRLKTPSARGLVDAVADADARLQAHAELVQKAIFPHRKANPISHEVLRRVINSQIEAPMSADAFESILSKVLQRSLVPGLHTDGFELYLVEEHASWKSGFQRQKKELIAKRAASFVQNGMSLLVDAGSTAEQVVQIVCRRIEQRAITRMTIATTSINIADMISDCCVRMGFDDDFSAVRLYVPGGQIRPGTQAIIPLPGQESTLISQLSQAVGGFDLAIVGVNGVHQDSGFTTHENPEAANKRDMIAAARRSLILGDSSKVGMALECGFASFSDEVLFIVDDDPENPHLAEIVERHAERVLLVKGDMISAAEQ